VTGGPAGVLVREQGVCEANELSRERRARPSRSVGGRVGAAARLALLSQRISPGRNTTRDPLDSGSGSECVRPGWVGARAGGVGGSGRGAT
jgi:hypothetical protein